MARGDSKAFGAYGYKLGTQSYNNSTDTFSYVFVTDTYASIDTTAVDPNLASYTQVPASGNYTGVTNLAGVTWVQAGEVSTLDYNDITIASDGANPTTVRCMLIINDTSAGDDAVRVVDITTDGTTPVDLTQGYTHTVNASGALQIDVNP